MGSQKKTHLPGPNGRALCGARPGMARKRIVHDTSQRRVTCAACRNGGKQPPQQRQATGAADWSASCEVCGMKPVVQGVGLCGPCTFGEAETIGGNW